MQDGGIAPGGKLAVNTNGGGLSYCHPGMYGIFLLIEAVRRFTDPPHVPAGAMLIVATGGLLINIVAFLLLRAGAKESLNVRGAYLEVVGDLLGSVGVIVAAVMSQVSPEPKTKTLHTRWRPEQPQDGRVIVTPRAEIQGIQGLPSVFRASKID